MSELKITIKDIDDLKNHLAASLEDGFNKRMDPLVGEIKGAIAKVTTFEDVQKRHTEEIKTLKATQAKALAMWTLMIGMLTTGCTLLFAQIKLWLVSHFHS